MMEGDDSQHNRRFSEHSHQASPSYFRNVVPLGLDSLLTPLSVIATRKEGTIPTTSKRNSLTTQREHNYHSQSVMPMQTMKDSTITSSDKTNSLNSQGIIDNDSQRVNVVNVTSSNRYMFHDHQGATPITTNVRSRKCGTGHHSNRKHRHRGRRRKRLPEQHPATDIESRYSYCNYCLGSTGGIFWCCYDRKIVRNTLSCMKVVARVLSWCTVVAMVVGVIWYSYELKKTGKDPHLIFWNSAAAFVLIGFPISIYGIVMHLTNYNQPETQSYIVRILWMVPMYSIQSWLGLRYKNYSIYFETIRDFYEAYVLYSFLQFLVQVLGGEEALILMLKDKSPTRGVHIWGLQFFVKPWLMGQPVRKTYMNNDGQTTNCSIATRSGGTSSAISAVETSITGGAIQPIIGQNQQQLINQPIRNKPLKRVHWTSPFFLRCKFGVLQYVVFKFLSTIAVFILEQHDLYKESSFSYKGGYLYIIILTNLSQTWALYCFFFFYFATKNELTPIRPVGKFLSVKLLVFFTWWQSLFISVLNQMNLIPHYHKNGGTNGEDVVSSEPDWTVPLSTEDATALDELGGKAFWSLPATYTASTGIVEYSPEDVAKALQDYLICIEMFVFAIVHIFVFPHSEYSPEAVEARARALNQMPNKHWNKRLGRKWKEFDNKSAWSGTTNTSRDSAEIELLPINNLRDYRDYQQHAAQYSNEPENSLTHIGRRDLLEEEDLRVHPMDNLEENDSEHNPLLLEDEDDSYDDNSTYSDDSGMNEIERYAGFLQGDEEQGTPSKSTTAVRKKNFISALLDSTIPQDLRDNTVGIIKGDYIVERKTLLHHAATSDSYDLFSRVPKHKGETHE